MSNSTLNAFAYEYSISKMFLFNAKVFPKSKPKKVKIETTKMDNSEYERLCSIVPEILNK